MASRPRAHRFTSDRSGDWSCRLFRPHRALVPWRLHYATGRPAALRGPSTCFRGTSRPMRIMIGLMDAPSGESNHRAGARCAKRCGQRAATSRLRAAGLGASTGRPITGAGRACLVLTAGASVCFVGLLCRRGRACLAWSLTRVGEEGSWGERISWPDGGCCPWLDGRTCRLHGAERR